MAQMAQNATDDGSRVPGSSSHIGGLDSQYLINFASKTADTFVNPLMRGVLSIFASCNAKITEVNLPLSRKGV
jgi:hypothetical protein